MVKKNKKPEYKNLNNILKVYSEILELKNLFRQGWLKVGLEKNLCESVADHSFSTTWLAWLIAEEHYKNLNLGKVIKLSLIHEIGEIYTGDITPHDDINLDEKFNLEFNAVQKVFNNLANGKIYIDLWLDFEKQLSSEAIFVKQLDKLDMGLMAKHYKNIANINPKPFINSAKKAITENNLTNFLLSFD